VGDHHTDLEAASADGAKSIMVLSGRGTAADMHPLANYVAGDLHEAADLIVNLNNGFLSRLGTKGRR
jgi:phosphoglycolate phosphatase-like HAD superfamily hydrolase